jgi:membrane-anchored protein YejM (alkaline phosphatase superfamily)
MGNSLNDDRTTMIESVVIKLNSLGLLDNTHLILTSDHGYHVGKKCMFLCSYFTKGNLWNLRMLYLLEYPAPPDTLRSPIFQNVKTGKICLIQFIEAIKYIC